jgi:hypothetical protein
MWVALTPKQRQIMWISSSVGFLLVLIVIIVAVVLQSRMVPTPGPTGPNGLDDKPHQHKPSAQPSLFGNNVFHDLGTNNFGGW